MTLGQWFRETSHRIKLDGLDGAESAVYSLYLGALRRLRPLQRDGTNIYDRSWDLLILLDACRLDSIKKVADEYPFLDDIGTIQSVGSSSPEWMTNTFNSEYTEQINETHQVTGNIHSNELLSELPFAELDQAWQDGWDSERSTVDARTITDRVIDTFRNKNPNRVIAHYMQPHYPYMRNPELDTKNPMNKKPILWNQLRQGKVSESKIKEAYLENLRYVLDDVELLLENVDAQEVVITADHGEAFDEWGIYEHPGQMPLSVLRHVPWCTCTANDYNEYKPEVRKQQDMSSVENKLSNLGYT